MMPEGIVQGPVHPGVDVGGEAVNFGQAECGHRDFPTRMKNLCALYRITVSQDFQTTLKTCRR